MKNTTIKKYRSTIYTLSQGMRINEGSTVTFSTRKEAREAGERLRERLAHYGGGKHYRDTYLLEG
jgi:hypothetical protein